MSDEDVRRFTAGQFPLRPSGKDWDRLVEVVQETERRKYSGVPAETAVADLCDVRVLARTATRRGREVATDSRYVTDLANLWAEGFQFGVLFQRFGGTAHEHEPVPDRTPLVRAMQPARVLYDLGDSVHPDRVTMDLVLEEIAGRFTTDVATEAVYNDVVDVYAMVYLAANRVGLNFGSRISEDEAPRYTDAWVEGFLYGVLFERLGGAAWRAV